jgi:hypothetical protein
MHMQRDENATTPPSISEPKSQVKKQSMHSSIQQAGESQQNNPHFLYPHLHRTVSSATYSSSSFSLLVSSIYVLLRGISYLYYACSACYISAPALPACLHYSDRPLFFSFLFFYHFIFVLFFVTIFFVLSEVSVVASFPACDDLTDLNSFFSPICGLVSAFCYIPGIFFSLLFPY